MTEIFHYVYRITNTVENKHYYGKRSSKCEPKEDLGKKYFSSSCDSKFRKDQKENPQNYRYKIVQTFKDPISAIAREVKLHSKFDVAVNAKFYNRSKQTNIKFDTTGTIGPNLGKPSKYKGIPRSKEILDKISKSRTGIKLTEKHKSAIAKSLIGHKQSEETKDKKSKATKGIPKSEEHKKKISVANKGKKKNLENRKFGPRSEETKIKISLALKGIPRTEESKRNQSIAQIGRKHSEETKKKISDSRKK